MKSYDNTSNPTFKLYNQNCIEGMKEHVKDDSIDLIFTDPPYGIDGDELHVHYHRDESSVVSGYVDVPLKDYANFSLEWIKECERCLRPGGSIYIVSGYTNLHHILNALHSTSLKEINHLIGKYTFGVSTTKKFVSSHYHILFWSKPEKKNQKRTFNTNWKYTDQKDSYNDRLSVQEMVREYKPGQIKNKNQLSEAFIEKFILYSSNRGDIVMDCFGGSFSTAKAALKYGRNFLGFEINKNAFDVFSNTLDSIEFLDDPVPISPSNDEMQKRIKMRENWKKKRQERKNDRPIQRTHSLYSTDQEKLP